jgi:hypothetical protein
MSHFLTADAPATNIVPADVPLIAYRRALLKVISIANLWVYLGFNQCCFLGSKSDVYLRSLYWWFLVTAVCLLQAGIPGNLHTLAMIISI